MRRMSQLAGWLLLTAIVVLSMVAPSWRPVTILPHNLEHAAIFALAGFAIGLGYLSRVIQNTAALVLFAAAIELAQFYAPWRHPRLIDFLVDALAACAGIALAVLLARLTTARTASPR